MNFNEFSQSAPLSGFIGTFICKGGRLSSWKRPSSINLAALQKQPCDPKGLDSVKCPLNAIVGFSTLFLCLSHTKQHLLELPVLTQPLAARLLDKSILARFWSRRTSQRKRLERIGPDMVTELDRSNTVSAKSHECWYFREKRINVQKMFRKYNPFTQDGKRHAHCILPIGYAHYYFDMITYKVSV